ncbi:MAG TPA: hypothetical protein DCX60_03310 [Phycisphaerales bacterium]|nr:hypothetical protein [Phycisphaerales bacterium]
MTSLETESIRIICPNLACQRLLAVPQMARGEVVRCRGCGSNIKVPASASQSQSAGQARVPGEAAA